MSLLPNGKVLMWSSVTDLPNEQNPVHNKTQAVVFDPIDKSVESVDLLGHNVFCSGFAKLPDGRVFSAGGNANADLDGIRNTDVFNPDTSTWSPGADMAAPRWYPSVTPLSSGEMLITGGGPAVSEVRALDASLRALTTASSQLWANREYSWLQTAPSGKVVYLGPDAQMGQLDTTATGTWAPGGLRDSDNTYRAYGSYAMYDAKAGKVLVAGGADTNGSALVVDTVRMTSAPTGSMRNQRRQFMLTLLADGTPLAVGGISGQGNSLVNLDQAVTQAESWNPATGAWTQLAAQTTPRQYHSAALLLPDGRVLSAGGGICLACQAAGYLEKNYEIFTPPYLYRADGQLAARPSISSAPSSAVYGQAMSVRSPQASSITKIGMVRLGSATHAHDQEQRYVPLTFARSRGQLRVDAPANAAIAPPGYYMLFLVDSQGVPSVSKIIQIKPSSS